MRGGMILLVALVALPLSGCLKSKSGEDAAAVPPSTAPDGGVLKAGQGGTRLVQPAATTDTLHLAAAPEMGTGRPGDGDPMRTPVADLPTTLVSAFAGSVVKPAKWTMELQRLPSVKVNATVWVDVEGPVVASDASCAWSLQLFYWTNTSAVGTSSCVREPAGAVATGARALQFSLGTIQAALPGRLEVTVTSGMVAGPTASVVVLSGSAQADSQVTLAGLKLPLDGAKPA
jgi:hypothetical protein